MAHPLKQALLSHEILLYAKTMDGSHSYFFCFLPAAFYTAI
jgi:hypothetical protein